MRPLTLIEEDAAEDIHLQSFDDSEEVKQRPGAPKPMISMELRDRIMNRKNPPPTMFSAQLR